MKISTILSLLGLLSTSIAAPSHSEERDVNIVLHGPASDHVETTMGGPLSSGVYFISSPALEERGFVLGRGIREDRSLLPKPIKTVSRGDAGQIFVFRTSYLLFLISRTNILLSGGWTGWMVVATDWASHIHQMLSLHQSPI
jgi:hypothetical protein